MKTKRRAILVMLVLLLCAGTVHSAEFSDHPLIGRYQGSTVIHQEESRLDEYTLGLGAARDGKVAETLEVTVDEDAAAVPAACRTVQVAAKDEVVVAIAVIVDQAQLRLSPGDAIGGFGVGQARGVTG